MRITPFQKTERTFLKLTIVEWGLTISFIMAVPGIVTPFLHEVFDIETVLPRVVCIIVAIIVDSILIYIKGKEDNYLGVMFRNKNIPDVIEGAYPSFTTITRLSDNEKLIPGKK